MPMLCSYHSRHQSLGLVEMRSIHDGYITRFLACLF
jgi:hypothetical protein